MQLCNSVGLMQKFIVTKTVKCCWFEMKTGAGATAAAAAAVAAVAVGQCEPL